jgi:hypothetical protein
MDFLDPKRKKASRRRLLIGYVLMAVAIALATFILLLTAYGFDIDHKTGSVIQNGIVYVDTQPDGANIYVDGKQHSDTTSARLNLREGQYTIKLTKQGYRDWQRTFFLDGGQIQRIVYPLLIPNTLTPADVKVYDVAPSLTTQSPDRHWILVQQPGQTYAFDMYDGGDTETAPTTLTIPATILTEATSAASLKIVEWSNDNRHFLVDRTYGDGSKHEFLVIDRQTPEQSVSINTVLGISPTKVSLRDKKADQIYFVEGTTNILRSGDTKSRTISAPLISGVLSYKSYSDNLILYATQENVEAGRTEFKIREDDKTYTLKTVPEGSVYLTDLSKYDGNWYYALGSNTDDAVYIYKNPLDILKGKNGGALTVASVLRVTNPQFVSFSANVQFVSVQSGKNLMTYDIETDRQFTLKLSQDIPLAQQIKWMDGNRFAYASGNQTYMVDFDGSNPQALVPGLGGLENPIFDRDYELLYTIAPSVKTTDKFALTRTQLQVK